MGDNGAFSAWTQGKTVDWNAYYAWSEKLLARDNTWVVIGDVIDGSEDHNDALIDAWPHGCRGAPVWHLHESLERLKTLCNTWPRICFGSSGTFKSVGGKDWHARVLEAFSYIVDASGKPPCQIHMLRGMRCLKYQYPFASVDSTDIARNHSREAKKGRSALAMALRWESMNCPDLLVSRRLL